MKSVYENPAKAIGGLLNALIFVLLGALLVIASEIHKESKLQTAWAAQCDAIREVQNDARRSMQGDHMRESVGGDQ